jgi:hypothetical protein
MPTDETGNDVEKPERDPVAVQSDRAEGILSEIFDSGGWRVRRTRGSRASGGDLVVRRAGVAYTVAVKSASEGRSDRLIPLWSQAFLQASHAAGDQRSALAVVAAPKISAKVASQVLEFAARYAPGSAAGVIDHAGLRMFRGELLEELNAEPARARWGAHPFASNRTNLFSDLNQWMLKVLLAPELPEPMLSAPRGRYRNASQLAAAANVSVVSASRLVRQLQHEGYLHESKPHLDLVRREELFRRWQSSGERRVKEVSLRFLLRGNRESQVRRLVEAGGACVALFAAAEALGVGFVHGVPPYLYLKRLSPSTTSAWNTVVPAPPGEAPELIVREAPAPTSVFRGAVDVRGVLACDILQIWLDVSSHPSRGQEQAELIRRKFLDPVINGAETHG